MRLPALLLLCVLLPRSQVAGVATLFVVRHCSASVPAGWGWSTQPSTGLDVLTPAPLPRLARRRQ